MIRPDDMQSWMLKLAEVAGGDIHNQVFVMRKVLTAAYMQGFDDGCRAAEMDGLVRRQIEQSVAEAWGGSGA